MGIDKCNTFIEMRTVDPAGLVSNKLLLAVAMGNGHDKANTLLERKYKYGVDIPKMKNILIGIIREVLSDTNEYTKNIFEKENGSKDGKHQGDFIICEVVTKRGLINWECIHLFPR